MKLPPRQRALKRDPNQSIRQAFRNENGAIDLASIMVGIIVIGMIGGVIAATVFAVIPWAQDNAAKQQLDSIVAAESAYMGLTSAVPPAIQGAGHLANSYGNSTQLASAKLLAESDRYCVVTTDDGKGYQAYSKSSSGNIFTATDQNTRPSSVDKNAVNSTFLASLPDSCKAVFSDTPAAPTSELVLTYASATEKTVELPIVGGAGTITWSDSATPMPYDGTTVVSKVIPAGEEVTVTIQGTVDALSYEGKTGADALVSVETWGDGLGITDANNAFYGAKNLTDIPETLPSTITDTSHMFDSATNFNDKDVEQWDMSNVDDVSFMFKDTAYANSGADLSGWDLDDSANISFVLGPSHWNTPGLQNDALKKTTTLTYQCATAQTVFLPIRETTSDVTFTWSDGVTHTAPAGSYAGAPSAVTAANSHSRALAANTPLTVVIGGTYDRLWNEKSWAKGKECLRSVEHWGEEIGIKSAANAFYNATNLTKVPSTIPSTITDTSNMFYGAQVFNQPLTGWDTSNITNMSGMFEYAQAFNQPLAHWNTSKVTDMSRMLSGATAFNQPIESWDTSKVTNMSYMFYMTNAFNQPLANWDTSKVTNMSYMFASADAFNQPIGSWNTSNVTNMSKMFFMSKAFNKPLNNWNTSKVTNMSAMFQNAVVFNQPLNNWNTSNVTDMEFMFASTGAFNQNISSWDVTKVASSMQFNGESSLSDANSPF